MANYDRIEYSNGGGILKITGYKSLEKKEHKKITSYCIEISSKKIMLDYGSKLGETKAKELDAIILSHEHFDHFHGLTFDLEYINCPIYATKTTKRLIRVLAKKAWTAMLVTNQQKLDNIIELEYYKSYDVFGMDLILYPSGHTFGSAMIYLAGEYRILYTGDMDYNKNNSKRQYKIDDFSRIEKTDFLLVDGTSLTKPYKTQTINRLIETSKKVMHRTYHVRPEKAVFIAQKMSEYKGTDDALIIYEKDLKWYLDILYSEGYYPYVDNKVVLDAPLIMPKNFQKTIRLSSTNYIERTINGVVGLHISLDSLHDFICSFPNNPKVLVGHYSLEDTEELEECCQIRNYEVIKEGDNIFEK